MRTFLLLILVSIGAFSGEVLDKKWESSANCYPCHTEIVKAWRTSRHAHSHFDKNDLFKKSLLYITKKKPTLILDEMKMKCAQCHNPRIVKSTLNDDDKVSMLLGHKSTQKAYKDMLESTNMKDGINCLVCHNVKQIHLDKNKGSQGMHTVIFGTQGTMYGPFHDATSLYHKSEHKEHFDGDKPDLCFSCHYSATNEHGLEIYSTGREYDATIAKNNHTTQGCKTCHMSQRKKGVASNYAQGDKKPKERMVRVHRFASVDNSDIVAKYVKLESKVIEQHLHLQLTNNTPHKIPSGYGLREIVIQVKYFDKSNNLIMFDKQTLRAQWGDDEGRPTIPHLATSILKDTRLEGKSAHTYRFKIPNDAQYALYELDYKLIGSDMAKIIGIRDPFFEKNYVFFKHKVLLK